MLTKKQIAKYSKKYVDYMVFEKHINLNPPSFLSPEEIDYFYAIQFIELSAIMNKQNNCSHSHIKRTCGIYGTITKECIDCGHLEIR